MKSLKKLISLILCGMMIAVMCAVMPFTASAANYSTNWQQYSTPTVTLKKGAKGNNVKWLQCAINDLIINGDKNGSKLSTTKLDVDGSFGPGVETAVKKFQSKYSLSADGSFGTASRNKMVYVLKGCVHNWTPYRVQQYATCTSEGKDIERCSKCYTTRTVTIPKKGHTLRRETDCGFVKETCTVCGKIVRDDAKDFRLWLKKNETYWNDTNAAELITHIKRFSQLNSTVKSQASTLGKCFSVSEKVLGGEMLNKLNTSTKNVCKVCDYIDLGLNLKTMWSNSSNEDRLNATMNAMKSLCSDVQCGAYYTEAIKTIEKGLSSTLKKVSIARMQQFLADFITDDFEVLEVKVNGRTKGIKKVTYDELIYGDTNVEAVLTKHYQSIMNNKNLSANQYCKLFKEIKRIQTIYGCSFDNAVGYVQRGL